MSWAKLHPLKTVVIILTIINFLAIGVIVFFIIQTTSKTASLDIYVAPLTAQITINNQEYSNGKYDFQPGEYTAQISQNNFETKTITLNLEDGITTNLRVYLTGYNNDFSYYKTSKVDFDRLENIATAKDSDAQKFLSDYKKLMSIKKNFPITEWVYDNPENKQDAGGYKIEDGSDYNDCTEVFCIGVTYYYKRYPEKVISKIKELGYNPDNYKIVYKGINL